jgi:hypothetical protein
MCNIIVGKVNNVTCEEERNHVTIIFSMEI